MLLSCLSVGAGGFAGSVIRYLISRVPLGSSAYPVNTFITNVIGAVLIGYIIARADRLALSPQQILLLKTGFCGGLTTFSTFSAETLGLLEQGSYLTACAYIILSLVLCVGGVAVGISIGSRI